MKKHKILKTFSLLGLFFVHLCSLTSCGEKGEKGDTGSKGDTGDASYAIAVLEYTVPAGGSITFNKASLIAGEVVTFSATLPAYANGEIYEVTTSTAIWEITGSSSQFSGTKEYTMPSHNLVLKIHFTLDS